MKTPLPKQLPKKNRFWMHLTIKIIVFLIGLRISFIFGFTSLYLTISGMYFIFTNLGQRPKGTLSAYSVFNENFEELPGTFSEHIPGVKTRVRENTQKVVNKTNDDETKIIESYFAKESKMANAICFCGSQLKFKKCCIDKRKMYLKK